MNFLQSKRAVKVLSLLLIITTLVGLVSLASFAEDKTSESTAADSTVKNDDLDAVKYAFTVDGLNYLKTGNDTVALIGCKYADLKDKSALTVNEVTHEGKSYKVTSIRSLQGIGTEALSLTVGENVTDIAAGALKNLEKVTVTFAKAENVKTLGAEALMGVLKLSTSIKNFEGLVSVGKDAFADIEGLELKADEKGFVLLAKGSLLYRYEGKDASVTLPTTVKTVADGAFDGNTTVTKINLNKATVIGNGAFKGCIALAEIAGTDNVTYLGKDALLGTKFYENLTSDDGFCRLSTDSAKPGYKVLVKYTGKEKKSITVPADVAFLSSAFDSVKDTLETLTVQVGVKQICDGCFDGFAKLQKVAIHNSTAKSDSLIIGSRAFAGTAITEFTVPAQVISIAPDALQSCPNLKTVLVRNKATWEQVGGGFYTENVDYKDLSVSFARYSPEQQERSIKKDSHGLMYYINMIFGYILRFCSFCSFGIYLIALFLFALIMKIILFPFGIKQQKSMIKQANFRPKEMAIIAKYRGRNDRVTQQKMQQEIMEARQKENIGMMSGCMPMLLQLPILFILYNVIMNPLRYICGMSAGTISVLTERCKEVAEGFTGITRGDVELVRHLRDNWAEFEGLEGLKGFTKGDLPNFNFIGIDLSEEPYLGMTVLILIPILTFLVSYFSMKISRKFSYQAPTAGNQDEAVSLKIMDFAMPALSTWIAFSVPAVIGCYWIFQNILSTVQQWVLSKLYPLPVFTEEDYKKAEKELMGKQPKAKPGSNYDPNKPRVRSLHHIDDDEDDLPPRKPDAVRDDEDDEDDRGGKPTGGDARIGKADLQ
ncbi:MAG: membrane protein insertase YidC [Ruminococcaceae bacterium]|nr:membrane protein insertase YidC [Oscillospiraceae bacterium]